MPEEQIGLDDSHLHHRFWDGPRMRQQDQGAKRLLVHEKTDDSNGLTIATLKLYRIERDRKTRVSRKFLRQARRDRVEPAVESPEPLWRIAKSSRCRGVRPPSVTPTTRRPSTGDGAVRTENKASLHRDSSFREPPETDLSDIENDEQQDQIPTPHITEKEVLDALQTAASLKATGPDIIPNKNL